MDEPILRGLPRVLDDSGYIQLQRLIWGCNLYICTLLVLYNYILRWDGNSFESKLLELYVKTMAPSLGQHAAVPVLFLGFLFVSSGTVQ